MGKSMTIAIKNMVCARCVKAVQEELTKAGITVNRVELGSAIVDESADLTKIAEVLKNSGFELLEDKKAQIVDRIKTLIITLIGEEKLEAFEGKFSDYVAKTIGRDYSFLSHLFSSVEGLTIERYLILQKIEKVKEWLIYNDITLSEISYKLGYSSVAHLSKQFKQITGLTPSEFKNMRSPQRIGLDKVGK